MFHFKKRYFAYFMAGIVFIPLLSLGGMHSVSALFKADYALTQHVWIFTIFRWLIISIFYLSWPCWVNRSASRHSWSEAKIHYWLQQRLRITGWLVIFEVFVCENMLWRWFH